MEKEYLKTASKDPLMAIYPLIHAPFRCRTVTCPPVLEENIVYQSSCRTFDSSRIEVLQECQLVLRTITRNLYQNIYKSNNNKQQQHYVDKDKVKQFSKYGKCNVQNIELVVYD